MADEPKPVESTGDRDVGQELDAEDAEPLPDFPVGVPVAQTRLARHSACTGMAAEARHAHGWNRTDRMLRLGREWPWRGA